MSLDHDRWKCREFVHRALRYVKADQLPLFWYYLAFGRREVLQLDGDLTLEVQTLCDEWPQLKPSEQQNVLCYFVLILESIAKRAASLPGKPATDDSDPE